DVAEITVCGSCAADGSRRKRHPSVKEMRFVGRAESWCIACWAKASVGTDKAAVAPRAGSVARKRRRDVMVSHSKMVGWWCVSVPHLLDRLKRLALGLRQIECEIEESGCADAGVDPESARRAQSAIQQGECVCQHKAC